MSGAPASVTSGVRPDPLTAEGFQAATNVSRETLVRLERYAALLRKWQPAINLLGFPYPSYRLFIIALGLAVMAVLYFVLERTHLGAQMADRVVVLNYGRIIADGNPATVRSDPGVIAAYTKHGRAIEVGDQTGRPLTLAEPVEVQSK